MATKAIQEPVFGKLATRWQKLCDKLIALAEEFPAEKFDYAPAEGTRSVSGVLRHVAFWNLYLADVIRGKKANDTDNELSSDRFSTREQILDALKRSVAEVDAALKRPIAPDAVESLISLIEHNCEHYGQLAVYARMNSIVPPASRG